VGILGKFDLKFWKFISF